jgi:hypothetical protein
MRFIAKRIDSKFYSFYRRDRAMKTIGMETKTELQELNAGDRIEVEHLITVGTKSWTTKTSGTVIRTERCLRSPHFARNFDDKVFSDTILLEQTDGELTSVTIDEFTTIRRA